MYTVRDDLLIVVNKEEEIKEFHFFHNQFLSKVSAQKVTLCHCFFGKITCSERKQKKTKC